MTTSEIFYCFVCVGLLLGAMVLVRFASARFDWSSEVQRKLLHLAAGLSALSFPFLFDSPWPVVILMTSTVGVLLILRLPLFAREGLSKALHGVERISYGEILLAIAVAVVFFRAGGEPVLFVLPILILTLSDAAAALVGVRYGTRTFQVEAGAKSLEGSAIFFLTSWILSMVCLLVLTDIDRVALVYLSVAIAGFATLVEADSWRGFDNLFVPVGVHLFLVSHFNSGPAELLVIVSACMLLVAIFTFAGSRLGLTPHAARAYAILAFLILSVTSAHNLILPLAVIAAHWYARQKVPCNSPFSDLDLIAASAMIGLFWLAFGEWHGANAINLFNLTFAALAFGLLSTAGLPAFPQGLLAGGLLLAAVLGLSFLNVDEARWYGLLMPWALAALVFSWVLPRWLPQAFNVYRSLRLSGLALATPVFLYVTTVVLAK